MKRHSVFESCVLRRGVFVAALFLTLAAAAAPSFLGTVRLREGSASRLAARWTTSDGTILFMTPPSEESWRSLDAFRTARDSALVDAAERWLETPSSRTLEDRRRDVLLGLARWDVDAEVVSSFLETPADVALISDAERFDPVAQRARVAESSRSAALALAEFDVDHADDDGIDAALSFLNELGADDAPLTAESPLDDAFWYFPSEFAGNPVDSVAMIAPCEFLSSANAASSLQRFSSVTTFMLLVCVFPTGAPIFGVTLRYRRSVRRLRGALCSVGISFSIYRLRSSEFGSGATLETVRLLI